MVLAMMTFLELNGMLVKCSDKELIQLGLEIASDAINQEELVSWIINHIGK